MIINTTALRIAAVCLLTASTPVWASETATCLHRASTPRLVCDEGACVRVPVRDLCDAVRASYPVKRRIKAGPVTLNPVRDELTVLIASVS
ncbi:hypothetical protein [Sphingomonas faeni]|uniref:hypothetical protein n=1 Tax=Sphingomonas faeni TaxID=185950 RepID=UPI00335B5975